VFLSGASSELGFSLDNVFCIIIVIIIIVVSRSIKGDEGQVTRGGFCLERADRLRC